MLTVWCLKCQCVQWAATSGGGESPCWQCDVWNVRVCNELQPEEEGNRHVDSVMSEMSVCAMSCNQRRRGIHGRPGPVTRQPGPAQSVSKNLRPGPIGPPGHPAHVELYFPQLGADQKIKLWLLVGLCSEPIQSRCAVLRYTKLTDTQLLARLCEVCQSEKVSYTDDGLEAVIFTAQGDMRQVPCVTSSVCGRSLPWCWIVSLFYVYEFFDWECFASKNYTILVLIQIDLHPGIFKLNIYHCGIGETVRILRHQLL